MSKMPRKRFKFTQKQAPAQNAESGFESLNQNQIFDDSQSADNAGQGESSVNYGEMTNIELARLIVENGWSQRAESTLNRLSKDELIFICKNQSDEQLERVSKANVETASDLVAGIIDLLDDVHRARDDKPNKESIKKFTQKQSVALAPYLNTLGYTNLGLFALGVGVALLTIDSFYGLGNLGKKTGFKRTVEAKIETK